MHSVLIKGDVLIFGVVSTFLYVTGTIMCTCSNLIKGGLLIFGISFL